MYDGLINHTDDATWKQAAQMAAQRHKVVSAPWRSALRLSHGLHRRPSTEWRTCAVDGCGAVPVGRLDEIVVRGTIRRPDEATHGLRHLPNHRHTRRRSSDAAPVHRDTDRRACCRPAGHRTGQLGTRPQLAVVRVLHDRLANADRQRVSADTAGRPEITAVLQWRRLRSLACVLRSTAGCRRACSRMCRRRVRGSAPCRMS